MSHDANAVLETVEALFTFLRQGVTSDPDAVLHPDFHAYEGGVPMSRAEFLALMQRVYREGRRYEWSVTQPRVEVEGNLAVVVHVNRGAILEPGAARLPVSWLETVVLKRGDRGWRIAFIHATRSRDAA